MVKVVAEITGKPERAELAPGSLQLALATAGSACVLPLSPN